MADTRATGNGADDAPMLPPHSLEAEQSLLGAARLDNGVIERVEATVQAEDFSSGAHRLIYEYMLRLHRDAVSVDVTTPSESLTSAQKLDYIGGIAYLGALVQNVPTPKNAEHYAGIVRDRARKRAIAAVGTDIRRAALGHGGESADDVLVAAQAADRGHIVGPTAAAVASAGADRGSGIRRREPHAGLHVDDYLFADVAVLVAPGGTGKTTLVLFEAVHIVLGLPLFGIEVRKPGPVLILTAEDRARYW